MNEKLVVSSLELVVINDKICSIISVLTHLKRFSESSKFLSFLIPAYAKKMNGKPNIRR